MAAPPLRPDAAKTMQELLAAMNADPSMLAGFNPSYVEDVNTLYQNLAGQFTGLDTEEGYARTGYERNIGELAANQARATQALRDRLASQGILQSTPGIEAENDLLRQFETQRSDYGTARDRSLADIAGRRLGFQNAYDIQLGGLNRGLREQATGYINTKAQEQRDRDLAKQQGDIQAELSNAAVARANQQIPAYAPPPIDLSALTSYLSTRAVPQAAPAAPKPAAPQNPYKNAANPYLSDPFGTQGQNPTYAKPVVPPKPTLAKAVQQVRGRR